MRIGSLKLARPAAAPDFWWLAALGVLIACALFGGASRADEIFQIVIRLIALGAIVLVLWYLPRERLRAHRGFLIFAGACILLALLQLVPLPPALWAALPGHGFYADLGASLGIPLAWRPASMTPDLTLNTALAMLPPLAMLLLAIATPPEDRARLVIPLLGIVLADAVLGLMQVAGGEDSPLRIYSVTNRDSMVGLFANRNHHALLLAIGLPVLGVVAASYRESRTWARLGWLLCLVMGLLLLLCVLITGSRAGLALGGAGAVIALLLYWRITRRAAELDPRAARGGLAHLPYRKLLFAVPLLLAMGALIAYATLSGRAVSLDRIVRTSTVEEMRFKLLDPLWDMMMQFMPLGSGLGSFDAVFRRFEPFEQLRVSYLNQAHNDLLQVAIEAGVPGLLLLAAFLFWWGRTAVRIWRSEAPATLAQALPRLGSIVTALQLVASLGDYPLRTPLQAAVFVLACLWMRTTPVSRSRRRTGRRASASERQERASRPFASADGLN